MNVPRIWFLLPVSSCINFTIRMHADKANEERQLYKNATIYIEQTPEVTSPETAAVEPPSFNLWNHPNKTDKTCKALLEKQGWTHERRSTMDTDRSALDKYRMLSWSWKRWMIGTNDGRESGKSVLVAQPGEDDIYPCLCLYIYIYIRGRDGTSATRARHDQ